jgi:myo-inositol-1(or 4)-monophosphatase
MADPTPDDLRKFCEAVLSWVGPLLVVRQATARATEKPVTPGLWDSAEMDRAKAAVTEVDLEVQARILDEIARAWPGHSVRFEEDVPPESAARFPAGGPYVWLIDPLDGTRNYADGSPHFGTILGVARRDARRIVAGAIVQPAAGRTYSFAAGVGAFRNRTPFTIRKAADDAPVYAGALAPQDLLDAVTGLGYPTTRGVRCAVAGTAMLLEGEARAYFACNADVLDVGVPLALVQEARGRVVDWEGGPLADWLRPRYPGAIASGDPVLVEELLDLTRGRGGGFSRS